MDGTIIIVLLLTSYLIYRQFRYGDPLKTEDTHTKVPKQYYTQYRSYLRSKEWQQLKATRSLVDGDQCIRCGSTSSLQCHHTDYSGIETMDFYLSQLETVCESCHKKIHKGTLPIKLHRAT